MKKIIFIILASLIFNNVICQNPIIQTCFEDEFNNGMNLAIWDRSDWRNGKVCTSPDISTFIQSQAPNENQSCNTFQAFRTTNNANVTFGNETGTGNLTLTGKAQTYTTNNSIMDIYTNTYTVSPYTYNYTAPSFFTSKKKIKYGYFEVSCLLPEVSGNDNYGIGANFWLSTMGTNEPYYTEIDVFEFLSKNVNGNRIGNIYTCNAHSISGSEGTFFEQKTFNGNYHKFGLAWFPNSYEYYIDGSIVRFSSLNPSEFNAMKVILDMNLMTFGETVDQNTILPYNYKLDYCKVYQYQNIDISLCEFNNYIPTMYRKIILGGSSCNLNNLNLRFRASEEIIFNSGFSASLGSSFIAEIIPIPDFVCE